MLCGAHNICFDLSADDDVLRQSSPIVRQETGLRQLSIDKATGTQQTTIASPLLNLTLATRYAPVGERISDIICILLRRCQGKAMVIQCDFHDLSRLLLDR